MVLGGLIVGSAIGLAGSIIGADSDRKARNKQADIATQKGELYAELTASQLKDAEKNFKQNYAQNILGQSVSGIELTSETYQRLNEMQYQDYLTDVENIERQGQFYQLGVESELASIEASKPSTIQQGLSFLTNTLSTESAYNSMFNAFSSPAYKQDITAGLNNF